MKLLRLFIPWVSFSFVVGCFAAYFTVPLLVVVAMCVFLVAILALLFRKYGRVLFVCVCVVSLLLGVVRVLYAERHLVSMLVQDNPGAVRITGRIVGDIEDTATRSRYVVRLFTDEERARRAFNGDSDNHEAGFFVGEGHSGNSGHVRAGEHSHASVRAKSAVLVYEQYPTLCVTGEDISVVVQLQEPEDFITGNGRVFKYKHYLRQSGIHALAFVDEVVCDGQSDTHAVFAKLRVLFVGAMHAVLPSQEASLLGGLLLGLRGALSADLLEAFRVTGLIHIIVLSGYNITIVAEAVRRLLVRLPRFVSFTISFIVIIVFVFLAGVQTAAVRAGSMASLALIARVTYREHDGVRVLMFVAAMMALYNPDQVLFSVSFHLSFLATLGLLIFSPIVERNMSFVTERFQIREIISVTVATQVFLLPYLSYAIGEVSLIGILANILILPVIPFAMGVGAAVTVLAVFSPAVASVFAPIAYVPLAVVITAATYLSEIPYASVPLPEVPAFIAIFVIALLVYLCFSRLRRGAGEERE